MKGALVSLVVVFILIMTLAGGCVPAAMAENASLLSQPAPAAPSLDDPEELERFLDALIDEHMTRYHIPSEAIAVVKDGQVVFAQGYGHADLEKRTQVDPEHTLFRIGSVSKLFVWTAIMQLAEQGKLDLDADVNTYLARLAGHKAIRIPDTYPEPITLAHLLTHTAGFDKQDAYGISRNRDGWMPLEEYLAKHMPERVYPPGQVHVYSNYGTSLAAYIVQQVSGMPFEEYVEQFIFEPLGMARSTFRQPLPPALSDDLATGVVWWFMKSRGAPAEFEWMQPAGSMSSTASDMARFMIAHLENERRGDGESSHRILQEQTALAMHSQHFTYDPRIAGFTYGFFEDRIGNTRVIYHAGGTAAFSAHLALIPEHNAGLFEVYSGGQAGAGFVYSEFVDHFFPGTEMHTPAPRSGTSTKQFTGEYLDLAVNHNSPEKLLALIKGARIREAGDGTLTFLGSTWVPVAPLTFQEMKGGDLVVFRTDDGTAEGRVTALIHDELVYERLPWYRQTALHAGVLIACLLIFLSAALGWPVAALIHSRSRKLIRVARLDRLAVWLMSVTFLGFVVGFAVEVWSHGILYYGLTPVARVMFFLPVAGTALGVVALISAGMAWMRRHTSPGQPSRGPARQTHLVLVTLAGIVFGLQAGYWNLMGL